MTGLRYRCPVCDVLGTGDVCWCCGTSDVLPAVVLHVKDSSDGPRFHDVEGSAA